MSYDIYTIVTIFRTIIFFFFY